MKKSKIILILSILNIVCANGLFFFASNPYYRFYLILEVFNPYRILFEMYGTGIILYIIGAHGLYLREYKNI
jgi:hypothetical protein